MKKKFLTKSISILLLALTLIGSIGVAPVSAATVNLDDTKKETLPSSITIRGFALKTSGKIYAYTDSTLTKRTTGYIDCKTDELVIEKISSDGRAIYIKYPIGNGKYTRRWFSAKEVLDVSNMKASFPVLKANSKITSYRRYNGGSTYGYVGKGDKVYVLGVNATYTGLLYPLSSGGYKFAFVKNTALQKYMSIISTKQNNSNSNSGSTNTYISDSEIKAAASKYGIKTGSNAYKALQSMNNKGLTSSQKKGTVVFMFEGVGSSSSSSKRMNAMAVVVKNGKISYINKNCSTIPDYPFNPKKNEGTPMPTLKSGTYSFSTVNHRGSYAALNVSSAKVVRFKSKSSYYSSTSSGINIHRRDSNSIASSSASWVNSAGCLLIGASGKASSSEYAQFIKAVGIVGSGASATSKYATRVSGTIVVDRTYAYNYLRNVGYSDAAIKLIG